MKSELLEFFPKSHILMPFVIKYDVKLVLHFKMHFKASINKFRLDSVVERIGVRNTGYICSAGENR